MSIHPSSNRYWKVLSWSFVAVVINLLIFLPLPGTLLALDFEGMAFAQTGPPDDTPTPIPTATPTYTPTPTPTHTPGPPSVPTNTPVQQSQSEGVSRSDEADQPTATFTPLPNTMVTATPIISIVDYLTTTSTSTPIPITGEPTLTGETPMPAPESVTTGPILVTNSPPAGVPPLTYRGHIYQIPANPEGAIFQLPLELTDGAYRATLSVPSASTLDKVVRIEEVALTADPPALLPPGIEPLAFFNLDIYLLNDSLGASELNSHSPELVFVIETLNVSGEDRSVLLRYDEFTQQYEFLPQEYDFTTKIVRAFLSRTSFFVLGKEVGQSPGLVPVAPVSTPPEPSTPSQPVWLFLIMLAGFVGVLAIFLLLGGGKFIGTKLQSASLPSAVENHNQAGGIVFTFDLPASDKEAVIQATLALLPPATLLEPTLPQESGSVGLNLSSVELYASIRPLRPDILAGYEAVTVPDDVDLVGWRELEAPPHRLTRAVFAGHLTWHDQAETFARLLELQSGDTIVVTSRAKPRYRYVVDKRQYYQADTVSVIKMSQTSSEAQLILIAWSEAYDIDRQVYRDYIVVQAHFAGPLFKEPLGGVKMKTLAEYS